MGDALLILGSPKPCPSFTQTLEMCWGQFWGTSLVLKPDVGALPLAHTLGGAVAGEGPGCRR